MFLSYIITKILKHLKLNKNKKFKKKAYN